MKSELVSGRLCFRLSAYDTSPNRIEISETRDCMPQEQRLYAIHKSGAEKKMVSSLC